MKDVEETKDQILAKMAEIKKATVQLIDIFEGSSLSEAQTNNVFAHLVNSLTVANAKSIQLLNQPDVFDVDAPISVSALAGPVANSFPPFTISSGHPTEKNTAHDPDAGRPERMVGQKRPKAPPVDEDIDFMDDSSTL